MLMLQQWRNVVHHFLTRELVVGHTDRVPAFAGENGGGCEEKEEPEEGREGGDGMHCRLCGRFEVGGVSRWGSVEKMCVWG
jgi:hypothetical protein